jgi:uncharacterized membrane protein YjfL (UPF0719 family)
MNGLLVSVGAAKIVFGFVIGVVGMYAASRLLARMLRNGEPEQAQRDGNTAVSLLFAAGLLSIGNLLKQAVVTTFSALDVIAQGAQPDAPTVAKVVGYGLVHASIAILVGCVVLSLGVLAFSLMTRGVDERAQIRAGGVGPALVLSAVLLALSMLTAPGLDTVLNGLLPLPALGRAILSTPA